MCGLDPRIYAVASARYEDLHGRIKSSIRPAMTTCRQACAGPGMTRGVREATDGPCIFSTETGGMGLGELRAQRAGVDRGADLGVIVEIHIDVAAGAARRLEVGGDQLRIVRFETAGPQLDSRRPVVESLVRIAARVELLGAVQAQIDEVGSQILGIGPRHRVRRKRALSDAGATARQRRGRESSGGEFDRVPQLSPALGPRPGAAGEPVVVAAGERGGSLSVARQDREETVETFGVKSKAGRELP